MSRKKDMALIASGLLAGLALSGPANAAVRQLTATPSSQPIYVAGRRVTMTAYGIEGSNYVQLRDVGKVVGFNVYWDSANGAVQIETDKPYTGAASRAEEAPTQTTTEGQDLESVRQEIIDRTNALRAQNGLPALGTEPLLSQAAQVRAEEMAATITYSHTRPDGSRYYTVTDCPCVYENIHRIPACSLPGEGGLAELAVQDWADSPGHLENMLRPDCSAIGVGVFKRPGAHGADVWYCVQLFLYQGQTVRWVDEPILTK